ncbi:MAG TPA: hypothetical protein VGR89_15785, partial [Puia sp.]|nr:hypothetical protein [Puia sp.]
MMTSQPTIRFFPEGGSLVNGVINKIAFKAARTDGSPAKVQGAVEDDNGHKVADFFSNEKGLGYFYLTPSRTATYIAQWSNVRDSGAYFRATLPPVHSTGISMDVRERPGERMVTLRGSADLSSSCYALGTFDGTVAYLAKIDSSKLDSATFDIPVNGYPDGTLTLTILDNKWSRIAERILFIRGEDTLTNKSPISVFVRKKARSTDEVNEILLRYTGSGAANISVAVTDAALPRANISGMFYDSTKDAEDLDLTALTSEWKRQDWKSILTQQPLYSKYPRDTGYYFLSGRTQKRPGKEDRLLFLIKRNGFIAMDTVTVARNGVLADTSMLLFDTTRILYRPTTRRKNYTFLFDHLLPAPWGRYPFPDETLS